MLVKSFEINELPVRCARFVPRKQWIITASDDNLIRVYNYNTMAKIKTFEAHSDYVRNLAVHPTQPYLLSASDDMTIKLWDWEKGWKCTQMYEGHSHYVMMVCFNPKDSNTFASASLDRSIKVRREPRGPPHPPASLFLHPGAHHRLTAMPGVGPEHTGTALHPRGP